MKHLVFVMKIVCVLDCEVRIIRRLQKAGLCFVTPVLPYGKTWIHWTGSKVNSILRTTNEQCEQIQVC
jgi:hypothetical protein